MPEQSCKTCMPQALFQILYTVPLIIGIRILGNITGEDCSLLLGPVWLLQKYNQDLWGAGQVNTPFLFVIFFGLFRQLAVPEVRFHSIGLRLIWRRPWIRGPLFTSNWSIGSAILDCFGANRWCRTCVSGNGNHFLVIISKESQSTT